MAAALSSREELDAAMRERDSLEAEAEAIRSELESPPASGGPPAGVKTPLVDAEGYPRADLDLWRVRTLRHRLACIQTDHKAAMKRIEALLPVLLAPGAAPTVAAMDATTTAAAPSPFAARPFAVVNHVMDQSPADRAGLVAGDQLVRYGDVTALGDVARFTRDNANETFAVHVRRETRLLTLHVMPQVWHGDGLLGCHLLPVD